jgi:chemotaxis protein MotA
MENSLRQSEALGGIIAQEDSFTENRVDSITILGTLLGITLIVWAILRGGDALTFLNLNAVLIVFGGTLATSFIAFPSKKILGLIPVIINAYKPENLKPTDYIEEIMSLAHKYRTGGLKKLESEEQYLENRFLKTGVAMIVDGYNSREIQEIMEREMTSMVERHNSGQKILRFMAVQAPVFGMAGTLIGLVQMLMHIDNPDTIGPSLATALITTFYGIILANLVITPIVAKLNNRTESETMLLKSLRVGVMGIHDRINPQKIKRNMNSLLAPHQQK